jgi:hypothetical protein
MPRLFKPDCINKSKFGLTSSPSLSGKNWVYFIKISSEFGWVLLYMITDPQEMNEALI